MTRIAAVLFLVATACAPEPEGLLVITEPGGLERDQPATVDVFVGVDHGLVSVPVTETRPFVAHALPDDRDREWTDPSQPYTILLEPAFADDTELYVVLRGEQGGQRFGANLARPVIYPGKGLYSVVADLYRPGDAGVCPHGTAEDAGYVVEILGQDPGAEPFDCDQDGVDYPVDCTDYDAGIRPSPHYPASSGIELPEEMLCCTRDPREPATMTVDSSGPGGCSLTIGCPGAPPFFGPRSIDWTIQGMFGDGDSYCECVEVRGNDPLDCLTGSHPEPLLPQPYCDLAISDDGSACPDQVATVRDRFRDFLPPNPTACQVAIVWQAGAVAMTLRGQGSTQETLSTDDCDADVVFNPTGPAPGLITPPGSFGWFIVDVGGRLVPMHVHPQPAPTGCDRPTECTFE